MAEYVTAEGFIQFDPQVREVNGQEVTDVTIKTPGSAGKLLRVTIWGEFDVSVEKGDWIAVDGKFSVNTYEGRDGNERQSAQISASSLVVLKGVKKQERGVVNEGGSESDFGF